MFFFAFADALALIGDDDDDDDDAAQSGGVTRQGGRLTKSLSVSVL